MPIPPPMQSETTPFFLPSLCKEWSSVTRTRHPEAPIGWPRAMAPPVKLKKNVLKLGGWLGGSATEIKINGRIGLTVLALKPQTTDLNLKTGWYHAREDSLPTFSSSFLGGRKWRECLVLHGINRFDVSVTHFTLRSGKSIACCFRLKRDTCVRNVKPLDAMQDKTFALTFLHKK